MTVSEVRDAASWNKRQYVLVRLLLGLVQTNARGCGAIVEDIGHDEGQTAIRSRFYCRQLYHE
jgi:hypothetical protein